MEPQIERVSLQVVVEWWLDMWEWRTEENKKQFDPYDGHPSYRAPFSLVITKFPWFDVNDRIDIVPLMDAEMKKRSKNNPEMKQWYKDYMKEKKDFNR